MVRSPWAHSKVRLVTNGFVSHVWWGGYNFCFDPQFGQLPHRSIAPGSFFRPRNRPGARTSSNFVCNPLRGWTSKSCDVPDPSMLQCRFAGERGTETSTGDHGEAPPLMYTPHSSPCWRCRRILRRLEMLAVVCATLRLSLFSGRMPKTAKLGRSAFTRAVSSLVGKRRRPNMVNTSTQACQILPPG